MYCKRLLDFFPVNNFVHRKVNFNRNGKFHDCYHHLGSNNGKFVSGNSCFSNKTLEKSFFFVFVVFIVVSVGSFSFFECNLFYLVRFVCLLSKE